MSAHTFSVSPDFPPDHLSGWFIFNTWLQRTLNAPFHLALYDDFASQRQDIRTGKIDLIYANPYDAATLVREKGFKPLAKFDRRSDEAVIAVSAHSPYFKVEDCMPGIRLASARDPDVHTMGMIMLESAELDASSVQLREYDNYVLVAKQLVRQTADVGIFLAEAFDHLSALVRKELRVLVRSEIQLVHHALMIGPGIMEYREPLREALLSMQDDDRQGLRSLGCGKWERVDEEEMEFMIDLMDTLMT
jgi:phosphonate transport system substrate-binding protein